MQVRDVPPNAATRRGLVRKHMGIARSLARRFTRTGEPFEDLEQVAYLGLVLAARRFDPQRGTDFVAFAVPTILGELKRHLRDCAWSAHVPRRIKELTHTIHSASAVLTHRLGRSPTVAEIAAELGASEEDVLEALEAGRSLWSESLNAPIAAGSDTVHADLLAATDNETAFGHVLDAVTAQPALASLSARKREVLALRFYEGLSQREIGERIGVSQVHVSRLISQSIRQVRASTGTDG